MVTSRHEGDFISSSPCSNVRICLLSPSILNYHSMLHRKYRRLDKIISLIYRQFSERANNLTSRDTSLRGGAYLV